ncbi:hypothetical protein JCM6882_002700 [Rhodosporidiobolus microsporus]
MQNLFTGGRPRTTINLGGASASSTQQQHGDLIARARREREQRELERRKEGAVRVIQAFYRGRRSARATRQFFRARFDELLASPSSTAEDVVLASRLLVIFFVASNAQDVKRVGGWCRAVLKPTGGGDKTPLLFSLFTTSLSWTPLIRRIGSDILFAVSTSNPSLPQAPLFLELSKLLCDPATYSKYKAAPGMDAQGVPLLLKSLLESGTFNVRLRRLLLAIPPTNRTSPVLPASIALALLPLKAYPPPTPAPSSYSSSSKPPSLAPSSPERLAILRSFALEVLSIPTILTGRVGAKETALLADAVPFVDVLHALAPSSSSSSSPSTPSASPANALSSPEDAAHLLANLFCVPSAGKTRLEAGEVKDGKTLRAYLEVVEGLMRRSGAGIFAGLTIEGREKEGQRAGKGKGKEKAVEEIVVDDDSDEEEDEGDAAAVDRARAAVRPAQDESGDTPMAPAVPACFASPSSTRRLSLPSETLSLLTALVSPPQAHLLPLLSLSSRFPSSTRPALASFLSTILAFLPSSSPARAEALNTLLYAAGGAGLIRELWRGHVRSGGLGRFLSSAGRGDAGAVLASLGDEKYAAGENEWATLVVVVELYCRCLVTMGDDEFHSSAPPSAFGGGGGGGEAASRNPLTLDEVTTLSSIARNAAFALYWLAGTGDEGGMLRGEGVLERSVVGTVWTGEEVRALLTRFLGEVHARDSRRRFTPEGHWHMTGQFDLASFVQTAVYEDERLSAESDSSISTSAAAAAPPSDDDEDDDEFSYGGGRRPVPRARARTNAAQNVLSKRQMALVSPRLGVLNNIPFVIPFETRVAIFRQFVASDYKKLGVDSNGLIQRARHRAVVRRNHLAEDAYAHLNGLGNELKKRVEIVFVDEHGMEESGIDGGGLFKELLTSLSKEVFDTNRGLWLATAQQQELYPNPHAYAKDQNQLSWYKFIGRILGKALYQGILVNVRFADFFLAKWLGRQSYLDDLASLDPELYRGLIKLKNYPGNVEEDLSLNFTITEEDFGLSRTIDLIPSGSEIAVTNQNRMQYILLVSNYRLNLQIAPQCRAFFAGLSEVINPRWLRMFNQSELAVLVGGTDEAIDIDDLRRNTVYSGWSADENSPTIRAFWDAVASFSKDERAQLVRFVTSCERPPLLGFAQLNPLFAIRKAGDDQERLPTSATCVNLLKLPEYTDSHNLREKLLYAISSGAGFDLS